MTAPPVPAVLLRVNEAAAELNCSTRMIRTLLERGELKRIDLNQHAVRIPASSIAAFIERGGSTA